MAMIDRRQMLAALGVTAAMPFAARATEVTSATDLRDDVAILREALKMHPGLYRYNTPDQIAARIEVLEPAFVAAPSREARYLILSRFLASIRCGHSYCNFFNQTKAVASALYDQPTRLPFHFRWVRGAMVVTDYGGLDLPLGSQVLSVDGVRPGDMLAQLMPYARADGHNDAKRVSLLEVRGDDTIEFFDVFHGLVFGPPRGGLHRIIARRPDGRRIDIEVPAIDLAQRRTQMVARDYRGDQPVWNWKIRADDIAILTMPSWALYDSKWDWRTWLDARLDSLSGAKGLIIDLRENEGGQQCGDAIFTRLADKPLPFSPTVEKIRFRRTNPAIDRYLDTWDNRFRTLGVGTRDLGDGWYASPHDGDTATIQSKGPRVTVPVATLVGPVNSSATFSFAFRAKSTGVIKLFGEPTGGNRRGINGGCFFFVRLPASGIEFDLPLIGYFSLMPEPDAGVVPDIAIAPLISDIAKRRDPALQQALLWLKNGG